MIVSNLPDLACAWLRCRCPTRMSWKDSWAMHLWCASQPMYKLGNAIYHSLLQWQMVLSVGNRVLQCNRSQTETRITSILSMHWLEMLRKKGTRIKFRFHLRQNPLKPIAGFWYVVMRNRLLPNPPTSETDDTWWWLLCYSCYQWPLCHWRYCCSWHKPISHYLWAHPLGALCWVVSRFATGAKRSRTWVRDFSKKLSLFTQQGMGTWLSSELRKKEWCPTSVIRCRSKLTL